MDIEVVLHTYTTYTSVIQRALARLAPGSILLVTTVSDSTYLNWLADRFFGAKSHADLKCVSSRILNAVAHHTLSHLSSVDISLIYASILLAHYTLHAVSVESANVLPILLTLFSSHSSALSLRASRLLFDGAFH